MKKSFDLIFGIGENCDTSLMLRRNNLQTNSFPFDWLSNSKFGRNIDIIINKFKDFFNKEDLEIVLNSNNQVNDCYYNKRTGLFFVHDFPIGEKFERQYQFVNQKYKRRYERLLYKMNNSKKILIVYITKTPEKIDNIVLQLKCRKNNLEKLFPKSEIYFLYIINSKEEKNIYYNHILNLKIIFDEINNQRKIIKFLNIKISYKKNISKKIMGDYKLKMTFFDIISYFIYFSKKIIINLIPNKSIQMKLRHRNKYN